LLKSFGYLFLRVVFLIFHFFYFSAKGKHFNVFESNNFCGFVRIFLIRHGETTGDVEERYGGDYDDSLSEKGILQAHKLSEKLNGRDIKKIFVSPKSRAVETALILKKKAFFELVSVNDLRERNQYGVMTGMVKSEAKKKFSDQVEELEANNPYHRVLGSEDYFVFAERVTGAFNRIVKEEFGKKEKAIAFVTHGGPITVIFREVLGFEIRGIKDCALFELKYDGDGFEIISAEDAEKIESVFS
jgi:broad specificity phosphatase PhoE